MKLYVGNLSWNIDEETLRKAFEQFGEIEDVRIITDRETGRSRGYGFITFTDDGEGQTAIDQMDGTELNGRAVKVNVAKERENRGGGGGRGGYGGGRGGGGGGGGRGGYGGGGGGGRDNRGRGGRY